MICGGEALPLSPTLPSLPQRHWLPPPGGLHSAAARRHHHPPLTAGGTIGGSAFLTAERIKVSEKKERKKTTITCELTQRTPRTESQTFRIHTSEGMGADGATLMNETYTKNRNLILVHDCCCSRQNK